MQTIIFDISNKSALLVEPKGKDGVHVLHAKQGDVGHQFKAVLMDRDTAYTIPTGAQFTVWFSGPSGEGNYSAIDNRSAFTVDGNTVAVEMIAQMLANPGTGTLCLILNSADGKQLGLWNVLYVVEHVPGMGSQAAENYYSALSELARQAINAAETFQTDASLSMAGKAADAAAVGKVADCTPYNGRGNFVANLLHVDLTNPDAYCNKASVVATEDASSLVDSPVTSGPFYAYREMLFINSPTGGLPKCIVRLTQAYPFQRNIWINIYDPNMGAWSGWEWENPPMFLGVEYRTTERWQGKAVYVKLIPFGALPNTSSKTVYHGIEGVTAIVDMNVYSTWGSFWTSHQSFSGVWGELETMNITTNSDMSAYSVNCLLKYTK